MESDDPGPETIQGVQLGATGVMARDRTGNMPEEETRRHPGDKTRFRSIHPVKQSGTEGPWLSHEGLSVP